jgi:hypothetical protein
LIRKNSTIFITLAKSQISDYYQIRFLHLLLHHFSIADEDLSPIVNGNGSYGEFDGTYGDIKG